MPADSTPVLIGAAQVAQRLDDPLAGKEPLDMMIEALERAGEDSGAPGLLAKADVITVIQGLWSYENPGAEIARRIGAEGAVTVGTPLGGNFSQLAVNRAALDIQEGRCDVAIVVGAEDGRSHARARKAGVEIQYTDTPGSPDQRLGDEKEMLHPIEMELSIIRPTQVYAMFESAIRHGRGESLDAHARRIATMWEGFNRVARDNPHAWIRDAYTADELRVPSKGNPMIGLPYPMLMNSNSRVDMGAAVVLCSLGTARRAGVPDDKIVYLHAGTQANDAPFASVRDRFDRSPAIRVAGGRALELSGRTPEQIDHCDLYSCFPSAVQVAATEIGIDESRPLTVTGGLVFGGGPLNCYVVTAIARMAEVLRGDPGSTGLVTANGGYLTKHAFGVYSTEPPADGFQFADLQDEVDTHPRREALLTFDGPVTTESYTVMHEGGVPVTGHFSCLTDEGQRVWVNVDDRELVDAMTREEFCGRAARLDGEGGIRVE